MCLVTLTFISLRQKIIVVVLFGVMVASEEQQKINEGGGARDRRQTADGGLFRAAARRCHRKKCILLLLWGRTRSKIPKIYFPRYCIKCNHSKEQVLAVPEQTSDLSSDRWLWNYGRDKISSIFIFFISILALAHHDCRFKSFKKVDGGDSSRGIRLEIAF
jgi:hypothetical protein